MENLQSGSQKAFDLKAGDATDPFTDVAGHYVDAVKALVENESNSAEQLQQLLELMTNANRGEFALFV